MSNSNVPRALRNIGITNMNITILDDNSGKFSLTKLPPEIGLLKNLRKLKFRQVCKIKQTKHTEHSREKTKQY